jgi:hypothetical protein
MNQLRCVVLMQLATMLVLGQTAHQSRPSSLLAQPEALIQSLYHQVVARHPLGIPTGQDMKAFAPYLSSRLLHRIELAHGCARDWVRQDQKRVLTNNQVQEKAPFGWAESGIFSGADERTEPDAFVIERTELKKNGSIRVDVRLTLSPPHPERWEVAAVLVRENGHFVVDDVIYLRDKSNAPDVWLSKLLSDGCNGSHWVGFGTSGPTKNKRDTD